MQLSLEFQCVDKYHEKNFMVDESNQIAFEHLANPDSLWITTYTVLVGPAGSGKTHLANIWQQRNDAIVLTEPSSQCLITGKCIIENIDRITDETALLHCLNLSKEYGNRLLLTSRLTPQQMPIKLPDLSSRLRAAHTLELLPPEQTLLQVILMKQFVDRHIIPTAEIINYILSHCERSVSFIEDLVALLDQESLRLKSKISIHMVKKAINALAKSATGVAFNS